MRVFVAPPHHYEWIAKRACLEIGPNFRAIEAVDEHWGIHGMIAFDGWTQTGVALHVALRSPIALRHLLPELYRQACVVMGKRILRLTIKSTNTRSLALVEHLGFREVFRGKDYFAEGVDMVLFEIDAADWRWKEAA